MKIALVAVFWTAAILVFFCLGVTEGAAVPCVNGGGDDFTTSPEPETTTENSTTIPPGQDASSTTVSSTTVSSTTVSSTTTTTPSTTSPSTTTTMSTTESSTTQSSATVSTTSTPSTTVSSTSTPSTTTPTTTVSSSTSSSTTMPSSTMTSTADWASASSSSTTWSTTWWTTPFWSTGSSSTTMSSTTDPCATTSPPANNRPQFSSLEGAYPTYAQYPADAQKLKTDMGLPDWLFKNGRPNTCAIRMSKTFHDAGLGIDRSRVGSCGTRSAGVNGNGRQYIIRALFFQCYLRAIWGEPDMTGITKADEIGCVQGVIIFTGCTGFGQHIDLWDGSACSMGCDYFDTCSSIELYILP